MVISFMGPPRIYRLARREKEEEESFSKKVEDANGTFFRLRTMVRRYRCQKFFEKKKGLLLLSWQESRRCLFVMSSPNFFWRIVGSSSATCAGNKEKPKGIKDG